MLYVDELRAIPVGAQHWRWRQSCHLIADSLEELKAFGEKLGLCVAWLQQSRRGVWHFDLTAGKRREAIKAGARPVDRKTFAKLIAEQQEI